MIEYLYGVPRIQQVLRKTGKFHDKARISRIMKQEGLKPKAARRFKVTTNSKHNNPGYRVWRFPNKV